MAKTSYAVALGSNRRHGVHGAPAAVLRASVAEIAASGIEVERLSRVRLTPAMGPAGRGFANATALLTTPLHPPALLKRLKGIEAAFGRRRGRRWGPRVLDLDIVLWSGGSWEGAGLIVPHPEFRKRLFVLDPLEEIVPCWKDPVSGASVRQLRHLLRAPRPVDPRRHDS